MCDMQIIYTLHILTYQSHTCYIVAAHLHPLDGAHNTIVLWHITSLVKCTASILYTVHHNTTNRSQSLLDCIVVSTTNLP